MKRGRSAIAALLLVASAAGCDQTKIDWVYDEGEHWPSRPVFPGIGAGLIAVTNSYDDTVSLHDFVTLQKVAQIPVGLFPVELEGPHHIVTSPDGAFLYVGLSLVVPNAGGGPHGAHGNGSVPGFVLKIRTADMRQVGYVRVDRNPGDLVLSPDGSKVYVSHFDLNRIEEVFQAGGTADEMRSAIGVIDTASMTRDALVPVCPAEHGITLGPDGSKLYVSCYGNDSVAVVDVADPEFPVDVVPVGDPAGALPGTIFYGPYAATMDPDGKTLWMSCWDSGDIRAFNTSSGEMDLSRAPIESGGFPMFGGSVEDRVLLARQSGDPALPDDRVLMWSSGGAVTEYLLPQADCLNAHQAIPDPTNPWKALVVCEGNHIQPGTLIRLDLSTGSVEQVEEAGIFPDAATFVFAGGGS